MKTQPEIDFELQIWKGIGDLNLSISHDHWHLDRVLHFAKELHKIYGGDWDVILASVLLHDLGRSDEKRAHGPESREASAEKAKEILQSINFPSEKLPSVLAAILEHDQPQITPTSVEGKILKDADFLAGFGAWGILRIALWAGEKNRRIPIVLERIMERMPERLENAEFPETKKIGKRELLFTNLFVQELYRTPKLRRRERGIYIVIEGISGSGKGTQIKLLSQKFQAIDLHVEIVREPTDNYRLFRDAWQKNHNIKLKDPMVMKFLLMADRYQLMEEKVKPALEEGKVVISDRSFVSTLVYQCETEYDIAVTAFDHRFSILPDLFILLDIDPNIAWERILKRKKKMGLYEDIDLLTQHRSKYKAISKKFFGNQLVIVDSSSSQEIVANEIWKHVVDNKLLNVTF